MLPRLFAVFVAIVIPGVMAGAAVVFLLADKPKSDATAPTQPVELGAAAWQRDYSAAVAQAKRDNKPLLVLFDEVPGCDTCTGFGRRPLSHSHCDRRRERVRAGRRFYKQRPR